MFTKNNSPRSRGRPRGRTPEGESTRQQIYEAAVALIGEVGYEAATLREVASRVGVSPALLYRYFPNKRAVVLALYDDLSEELARRAADLPPGRWGDRVVHALALSLEVLGPFRRPLRALTPIMVGDTSEGVFATSTAFSRLRVQEVFERAVAGAVDGPPGGIAPALGRLAYLAHLAVILWWLIDRSPGQRATHSLIGLLKEVQRPIALALRLPSMRKLVLSAEALVAEALLGNAKG
jgi:AcrR family transcriptional regulator